MSCNAYTHGQHATICCEVHGRHATSLCKACDASSVLLGSAAWRSVRCLGPAQLPAVSVLLRHGRARWAGDEGWGIHDSVTASAKFRSAQWTQWTGRWAGRAPGRGGRGGKGALCRQGS